MDYKTRKLLQESARELNKSWLETGMRSPNEKYFGLFTKKGMSMVLWIILALVIIADSGIFYLLHTLK